MTDYTAGADVRRLPDTELEAIAGDAGDQLEIQLRGIEVKVDQLRLRLRLDGKSAGDSAAARLIRRLLGAAGHEPADR